MNEFPKIYHWNRVQFHMNALTVNTQMKRIKLTQMLSQFIYLARKTFSLVVLVCRYSFDGDKSKLKRQPYALTDAQVNKRKRHNAKAICMCLSFKRMVIEMQR